MLTDPRTPTFIIAGAMRSGTTSLNAYLREHPHVTVSQPKEVHFFDAHFERGFDWYLEHFSPNEDTRAIGEATPDYMYDVDAPKRIAECLPGVKLVILLRDPAERAYSHYWHNRSVGAEDLSFESAIDAEPSRLSADRRTRARYSYVDRGRYRDQLERISGLFPPGQILVQTFDELGADPVGVFTRTCEFIGVDSSFRPSNLGAQTNAFTPYRSARLRNLSKRLPGSLRKAVGKLNRVEGQEYDAMREETRARIMSDLADDNTGLGRFLTVRPTWVEG